MRPIGRHKRFDVELVRVAMRSFRRMHGHHEQAEFQRLILLRCGR
jgi:hypothetical protein